MNDYERLCTLPTVFFHSSTAERVAIVQPRRTRPV